MHSKLKGIAASQGGVFTAAQARACGYAAKEIHRLRVAGTWSALRRGVYAEASLVTAADDPANHRLRIAAALVAVGPKAVASHQSAAALWGLETLAPMEAGIVRLTSPTGHPRRRTGLEIDVATLPDSHRAVQHDLAVTSIPRTAIDLGRELAFRDAVVVIDSARRTTGVTTSDLDEVLGDCWTWPGIRRAARAVAFSDHRSESVAESVGRVVFAEQGLPPPDLQVLIRDARGVIGRVDFLFREFHTIVEVDGRVKYDDPDGDGRVLWQEKKREDRLREAGYEVVRVTWADLMYRPEEVRARILAAFARAHQRRPS